MKITSLRLHPVAVSREYGTVIAEAGGEAATRKTRSYFYFLEVTTDNGLTGWGELSDVPREELPDDLDEFAALLADFCIGRSPYDVQRMHREFREHFDIENSAPARAAECALDMAMYDLQGRATGRPVNRLLGGALREHVTISWVAFIREDPELLREEIREKCARGFTAFKLKVGVDIDLDEERLAIARETAGPEASIKVDANAGWSVVEAPANIRRLNKYRLAAVETPVPRDDPAAIAAVRRQVEVPIAEHVSEPEYGLALLKADAVDVFNIATTGAGGLWPARQIVALAQAADIGVLIGSTVEMGPGTLAQLHLAATVPNLTLPSDLVGPGLYRDDVLAEKLQYRRSSLRVPTSAGLRAEIDRDRLRALKF